MSKSEDEYDKIEPEPWELLPKNTEAKVPKAQDKESKGENKPKPKGIIKPTSFSIEDSLGKYGKDHLVTKRSPDTYKGNSILKFDSEPLTLDLRIPYPQKNGKLHPKEVKYKYDYFPDPGDPMKNNVLSVSVIANDCMTADAYATAFKAMGIEKVKSFLEFHPELKVFLIFENDNNEFETLSLNGFPK